MNITILDDYQDAVRHLQCFEVLKEHEVKIFTASVKGLGQLSVRLRDTEVLVLIRERTSISRALLMRLPKLRFIVQTGRVSREPDGHIDLAACQERGITVIEGAGDPVSTAELTWALIMAAQRRLPHYIAALRQGQWQLPGLNKASMPPNHGLGRAMKNQTLGIWGYGRIGRIVATYGKAFGMNVQVWGGEASRVRAAADGFNAASSRAEFFASSGVLSLHLRLNSATRGIVTAEDLALMNPDALLVNTARAELIAPGALLAALEQGRPGMAALDVFEQEPLSPDNPLLRLENIVCTPHIGYVERDSYERYFGDAFHHLLTTLAGTPSGVVTP
jgi:D-3-phosphoglycerate dehydrogenase